MSEKEKTYDGNLLIAIQCKKCYRTQSFADIDNRGHGHCVHCAYHFDDLEHLRAEAYKFEESYKKTHLYVNAAARQETILFELRDFLAKCKEDSYNSHKPVFEAQIQKINEILGRREG